MEYVTTTLQAALVALVPALLFLLCATLVERRRNVTLSALRVVLLFAFGWYAGTFLVISLSGQAARLSLWDPACMGHFSMSMKLFQTFSRDAIAYYGWGQQLLQVVIPFLLLLPAGILLPAVFRACRSRRVTLSVVAGITLALEIVQGLIGRTADISDVLLGVVGALVGYALWQMVARRRVGHGEAVDGATVS